MTGYSEPPATEIACDESGSEGDKLIGGETDVFAYASVHMDPTRAADCVREIRDRIGSPALEYKANHLLRRKSLPVLRWLIGQHGPIHGRARVHLTDKALFVFDRMVDLLVHEHTDTVYAGPTPARRAMALTIYHEGRAAWGDRPWHTLLASFNHLMRVRNRPQLRESVDSFFSVLDELRHVHERTGLLGELTELLWQARPIAERLIHDPETIPPLDPLIAAFVRTIGYWSERLGPVTIVHDQQALLTDERVAHIMKLLESQLVGVRFVDSRTDPRVQIADFVAGIARTVASAGLHDRGDRDLTTLLAPYIDDHSLWAWSALDGALGEAGDEAVQEQVEHERDRHRHQHRGRL